MMAMICALMSKRTPGRSREPCPALIRLGEKQSCNASQLRVARITQAVCKVRGYAANRTGDGLFATLRLAGARLAPAVDCA